MGIRSSLKKLVLPILGQDRSPAPAAARPARPAPAAPDEEDDGASPRGQTPVKDYIEGLLQQHKVVLFMKGLPSAPQCGFSASAAGILSSYGRPFHGVNVLADPEVREGVKQFTSWPTIPQVFINGEFVGGADILTEMHNNGELRQALDEAYGAAGGPA